VMLNEKLAKASLHRDAHAHCAAAAAAAPGLSRSAV
jgi:hypothetical protein